MYTKEAYNSLLKSTAQNIDISDEMFDRARAVNSDNQLYRQAGNSVTIQVVYAVGRQILAAQEALEQGE